MRLVMDIELEVLIPMHLIWHEVIWVNFELSGPQWSRIEKRRSKFSRIKDVWVIDVKFGMYGFLGSLILFNILVLAGDVLLSQYICDTFLKIELLKWNFVCGGFLWSLISVNVLVLATGVLLNQWRRDIYNKVSEWNAICHLSVFYGRCEIWHSEVAYYWVSGASNMINIKSQNLRLYLL